MSRVNELPPRVIIYGGTGAAMEAYPIIRHCGAEVVAVFDDTPGLKSPFKDVPIYCGYDQLLRWLSYQKRGEIGFCIAIGNPHGRVRLKLHDWLVSEGLTPITIAHPSAVIETDFEIGVGSQILAGAVIDPQAQIGKQCIVNIHATVGHEVVLEAGSEIGPGAVICGDVHIGMNTWVCAGATVLPRIKIGFDAKVSAGAVVVQDVPDNSTVWGNPARVFVTRGGYD